MASDIIIIVGIQSGRIILDWFKGVALKRPKYDNLRSKIYILEGHFTCVKSDLALSRPGLRVVKWLYH